MSMAAGEYVSVQSQADTEHADIKREKCELQVQPESELEELTSIYVSRSLDQPLARKVAEKLMSGDAPVAKGAIRVAFWGALAMGLTAGVGTLFGTGG